MLATFVNPTGNKWTNVANFSFPPTHRILIEVSNAFLFFIGISNAIFFKHQVLRFIFQMQQILRQKFQLHWILRQKCENALYALIYFLRMYISTNLLFMEYQSCDIFLMSMQLFSQKYIFLIKISMILHLTIATFPFNILLIFKMHWIL